MRPDQYVTIAGLALCAVTIAGVYLGSPATWCRWIASWTRREPVLDRAQVVTWMVDHAMVHGVSEFSGWRVERVHSDLYLVTGAGRTTTHLFVLAFGGAL